MDARKIGNLLSTNVRISESSPVVVAQNMFALGSPWESDLMVIRRSGFWVEYEIKVSRSDFFSDFRKMSSHWFGKINKHEAYASSDMIQSRAGIIPKPKQFWFVTPRGLIKPDEVPSHCGLLEVFQHPDSKRYLFQRAVNAPTLRKPSKFSYVQLWNIALKLSSKAR